MEFEKWLLNTGRSRRSAKSYSGAISGVMSVWARSAGLVEKSLLEILSPKLLTTTIDRLVKEKIFIARNTKGNGMYSAALKAYEQYLVDISNEELLEDIEAIVRNSAIDETQKTTLVNARVGQGRYRAELIGYWEKCALSSFCDVRFLVASHIKPWKTSSNEERLDTFNGLLLLPNLDKVFDLGFITFAENGKIIVSEYLEEIDKLGIKRNMHLQLEERHMDYMKYHREVVFERLI